MKALGFMEKSAGRIFYNADVRKLIIKLPKRPQEVVTGRTGFLVFSEAVRQGVKKGLTITGAETIRAAPYAKQGDTSFIPRRNIPGRDNNKWPSIVVESGRSESLPRLHIDASWWLVKSNGLVKVAIIISVSHNQPDILIETWELQALPSNDPHSLRTTSQSPPRPVKTQEIRMSHIGNATVTVGALLTVRFFDIFLRAPVGAAEDDLVFTALDLEDVAHEV